MTMAGNYKETLFYIYSILTGFILALETTLPIWWEFFFNSFEILRQNSLLVKVTKRSCKLKPKIGWKHVTCESHEFTSFKSLIRFSCFTEKKQKVAMTMAGNYKEN